VSVQLLRTQLEEIQGRLTPLEAQQRGSEAIAEELKGSWDDCQRRMMDALAKAATHEGAFSQEMADTIGEVAAAMSTEGGHTMAMEVLDAGHKDHMRGTIELLLGVAENTIELMAQVCEMAVSKGPARTTRDDMQLTQLQEPVVAPPAPPAPAGMCHEDVLALRELHHQ